MKNHLLFFLCVMVAGATITQAATNVSGAITSNTTWNTAGSPYVVTSSIQVNTGVTLTIQSGVTVQFNNGFGMTVLGTLDATGTIFTSSSASPTAGIWTNITVGSSTVKGTATLISCQLSYGQQVQVIRGTLTTNGTDISNFQYYGVNINGYAKDSAVANITGGTINNIGAQCIVLNGILTANNVNLSNAQHGIFAPNTVHSLSSVTGGTISGMSEAAVMVHQTSPPLSLTNVTINNSTRGLSLNGGNVSLTNVTMNNTTTGLYLNGGDASLTGCTVTGSGRPVDYAAPSNLVLNGTANSFAGSSIKHIRINHSSLSSSMTLPSIDLPYYFPYGYTIYSGGRLQFSDGNIVKVDGGINVYQGKLIANASVGSQIYFTSFRDDNLGGDANGDASATAPAMNNWSGIDFPDGVIDSACILRRVTIKFADRGVDIDNASPTIDSCTFSNNYHGVYATNASYPVINGSTFGSSGLTPIAITFDADPVFTGNIFSFQDNQYDAIGLIGSTIVANAVLKVRSVTTTPNVTYVMLGEIVIPAGKSLTINKGVVIKAPYQSYYRIRVEGALYANGTVDSNIVMTSARDDNAGGPGDTNKDGTLTSPAVGDFGGVIFAPGSVGSSTLNYCDIRYANLNYTYYANEYQSGGAISMVNVSPTISNCKITSCNIGVMCYQASNPAISNNQVINCASTPFAVSMSANPTFINNTFTNAGLLGLGIIGGNVTSNGLLKKRDISGYTNITYVLLDNITIADGTNVEIENGVVIKMIDGRAINVDGGFKISGTPTSRVIITSIRDDNTGNPFDTNGDGNATAPSAGSWNTIIFNATSNDAYSAIRCADFKYAGAYSGDNAAVRWTNAAAKMDDCLITNTNGFGLRFDGNSNPVIDSVVIQNGNSDPIAMSLLSDPTFTNITFDANASRGIRILEGSLSSNAYLKKRSLAGISNIAYRISSVTINANATLTVEPGVVLKADYWTFTIDGALIAEGTPAQKIIFTSIHDDSDGGDYNNNGNATSPSKNQWYRLFFNNSNLASSLKNCVFRYGGGYWGNEGVITTNNNTNLVIDSCLIEQSSSPAFGVFGSSSPTIKNTQLLNIDNLPVHMAMFSNPTFTNITHSNVKTIGLGIIPETYSQNAVIPKRNFAGYNNITYFGLGTFTINAGTSITIPAGVVYKGGSWQVNGKLNVLGSVAAPVVFTSPYDDTYGNPADSYLDGNATNPYQSISGTGFTFADISNDSSIIRNIIIRYYSDGIILNSASPTIDSNIFNKVQYGVLCYGTSAPKLNNNIFHDLGYMQNPGYPNGSAGLGLVTSILTYPVSTLNNKLTGTTLRTVHILNENLSQDVTLPKRNFAGITNIPYLFSGFTVGTGATLTIAPGVVCKFSSGNLNVYKGLIAEGGSTADSQIVFTHQRDDFYGGVTDSNEINYWAGSNWGGIYFDNQSIDASCRLKNVVVKRATYGVNMVSASPTITNSLFVENNRGIRLSAASNPTVNYCDFMNNSDYGIENVDKTFTINAENCWWGNNTGPTHSLNIGGTGDAVTDAVDYTPFRIIDAQNPVMGDVSLNGKVQAYDAALILQKAVSLTTFNALQNLVGDVSGSAGITAFDASLVLQYVVGKIRTFPAEELFKTLPTFPAFAQLTIEGKTVNAGDEITLPVYVKNVTGMLSYDLYLSYDVSLFEFVSLTNGAYINGLNGIQNIDAATGNIYLSVAGTNPLNEAGTLYYLTLKVKDNAISATTNIGINTFLANEDEMKANAVSGEIKVLGKTATGIETNSIVTAGLAYPNPFKELITVPFVLNRKQAVITIEIYSIIGKQVFAQQIANAQSGINSFTWNGKNNEGAELEAGTYFILIKTNGAQLMQKATLTK